MIQKLKKLMVITMATASLLVPTLTPALAGVAFANNITDQLCSGTNAAANGDASGGCGTAGTEGNGAGTVQTLASKIVNIFSVVVGAVAVIMIIYGGFRYITSGGDTNRVGTAKNTLIYAIVGLIVVALAQIIVHFVINTTSTSVGGQ